MGLLRLPFEKPGVTSRSPCRWHGDVAQVIPGRHLSWPVTAFSRCCAAKSKWLFRASFSPFSNSLRASLGTCKEITLMEDPSTPAARVRRRVPTSVPVISACSMMVLLTGR